MLENTGQKTKLKPDTTKNKHNPEKANNAKQNYPGSVAFYDTRPGNEVGLFYNASKPTWGKKNNCYTY